jgi:hypothetical protein
MSPIFMTLLNLDPTSRQLRQFAWAGVVLMPLAGWMLSGRPLGDDWQSRHSALIAGLFVLGATFVVLSLFAPRVLRPIFIAASLAAFPISFVIGEMLLAAIYFLVFTPVGLVFRLMGRDPLDRKIDASADTYWQPKSPPRDVASYFRQS